MNLFDILGPIMVGPSSSHTAGAVRIGYMARKLLKEQPVKAKIYFYGSFATTGVGHGTDKAIVAGLLGMEPDDIRIPNSFVIAKEQGLEYSFHTISLKDAHPNTCVLKLISRDGQEIEVEAVSTGGGGIRIHKLDKVIVDFTAERPTLIVYHQDSPGYVAQVTAILAQKGINIACMQLFRNKRGGFAVMVIETDQQIPDAAISWFENLDGIQKVTYIDLTENITESEGDLNVV